MVHCTVKRFNSKLDFRSFVSQTTLMSLLPLNTVVVFSVLSKLSFIQMSMYLCVLEFIASWEIIPSVHCTKLWCVFPGDGGTWESRTSGTSPQSKIPSNEVELLRKIFSSSKASILLHISGLCDGLYVLANVHYKTCSITDEETNGDMSFQQLVGQWDYRKNREQYAREKYSCK